MNARRYLLVTALVALGLPGSTRAQERATEEQVKSLKKLLDDQVRTITTNDEKLAFGRNFLVGQETAVNKAIQNVNNVNAEERPAALVNAAERWANYQTAITALARFAEEHGAQLKYTGEMFDLVKKKEGEGVVPKGTLKVEYPETLEKLKKNHIDGTNAIKTAQDGATKLIGSVPGITAPPPVGASGPVNDLSIVASYYPGGEITGGSASGFIMFANYTKKRLAGTLSFDVTGGTPSPRSERVDLQPGQVKKVGFTITLTDKNATYKPKWEPDK